MKKEIKLTSIKVLLVVFLSVFSNTWAFAIPNLQLDVQNGIYVGGQEETIFSTSDPFTLYALLLPDSKTPLSDTYYISAALRPITQQPGSLGTFTFNGQTVNVTSDMTYGVPPWESNIAFDCGDLSKHGIFETYFIEFSFKFDPNNKTKEYNTQDNPGGLNPSGDGTMNYASFLVDTTELAAGYSIHFDLYSEKFKNGDTDINKFAPFSHDAEGAREVPEPSALLLLSLGMFGLAGIRKLKK